MTSSLRSFRLDTFARILWAATLLTLPVTSFRYFPAGDGTFVRPLAFYPLALLIIILLIQLLRGSVIFPRAGAFTPLAAFIMAAAAASLLGVILAPVAMRGQDITGRVLRAWATVFIGIVFFLASVWMNRNENDLRFSLQWLFAGFILDLL